MDVTLLATASLLGKTVLLCKLCCWAVRPLLGKKALLLCKALLLGKSFVVACSFDCWIDAKYCRSNICLTAC